MKDFGLKKLYYSISEVSKLTGLEQYILRYWETEFEQLKPSKNRAGNRIYTNKDINLILKIKKLLREEKYTIEGAKKILSDPDAVISAPQITNKTKIESVKTINSASNNKSDLNKDLEEIRNFLLDLGSKL
ncbi:MAG: MerR family transcriptional regulator [Bacteroidetes bacterium]|jgi:DNA-binding transcriptional MerR regulator|nr:MerR family transcriptional regulator [Bacteroidota bacterium]